MTALPTASDILIIAYVADGGKPLVLVHDRNSATSPVKRAEAAFATGKYERVCLAGVYWSKRDPEAGADG